MNLSLLLLLALQVAPPKQDPKADPPLEWNHHLGAAIRQALQKKTQIVLLFSTKTCGWCRRLQEETFRDPKVRALLSARVLVHLDLDEAGEIAEALGARAVPDVRLYTEEGAPLARQTGYLPAEPFREWLVAGAAGKPLADETSLKSLRLDSALDAYFDWEAKAKLPPADKVEALLLLAAGPAGETRTEAMRLVRKWAPDMASGLVLALGHAKLKVRLAAYEGLAELGAPMGKLDPWSGPVTGGPDLEAWLKARPAAKPGEAAPAPAPAAAWTAALEADLLALEDEKGARNAAARERLISGGPALVPRLRERSRTLRGSAPATAARLDEIRFRILLTPAVLRRVPDAASRLAVGSAGSRSQALEDILKRYPAGMEGLVREAVCDTDPLVRETATGSVRAILGAAARDALAELLKDPEANVRAAALREMAGIPTKGTAEAIRDYLTREKDPDMVGHAVRSLQEVPSATSRDVLRSLLASPHWAVRGASVKALMEMKDQASLPAIVALLEDPDEFVIGQALAAIAKLIDDLGAREADALVDQIGRLLEARPQLILAAIKTLSSHKLRSLKKTDALLRRFARHPESGVRAAAVSALAEDQERPAFEEVRLALEDKDARVRQAGAAGLRALAETKEVRRLIEQSRRPEAYPDCRKQLRAGLTDADAGVRLESSMTLIYFGDIDDGREAWKKSLGDPDPVLRKRALAALRWFGPEADLRTTVLGLWEKAAHDERETILRWLERGERGVETFGVLIALLPKIEEGERGDWADALVQGALGDEERRETPESERKKKEFARMLVQTAGGGLSEEHQALLKTLAQSVSSERTGEELRADLKSPQPMLRRAALAALVRGDEKLTAAELEPLVRDPEPKVRALALVACMPEQDRNSFNDASQDWLGGSAMRYFRGSSSSSGGAKLVQLPEKLLNERLEDADPEVRLRAAALMTLEGSDEALAYILRTWREKPAGDTRELLVRGVVGAWEDEYTSILEEVLETYTAREAYYIRKMYGLIQPLKGERIRAFRARLVRDYLNGN